MARCNYWVGLGQFIPLGCVVVNSKLVVTVAVLSLLASFAAEAATLNPTGGTVFTRTGGQGFHRVTTSTEVQPGDTVMAAPDGSAQILLS